MFNPSAAFMPLRTLAPAVKKTFDWAALLTNTQKTLNIVNQAIPIVYQAKPIFKNARTMLKIASEFTKSGSSNSVPIAQTNTTPIKTNEYQNINYSYDDNQPSFFI